MNKSENTEYALLFGGNISRHVARHWQTTEDLILAKLPTTLEGEIEFQPLARASSTALWPHGCWGATLTCLRDGYYLWGGWSHDQVDGRGLWALHMREATAEWRQVPACEHSPPAAAFHTATPMNDGKRMAVLGGLGENGSNRGVWAYDIDAGNWSLLSDAGPSCAGHAAGIAGDELAVFGGVERAMRLHEDDFSTHTWIFDLKTNTWSHAGVLPGQDRPAPGPRRNPVCATVGQHMIISGGWDDATFGHLDDTWAWNITKREWKRIRCNAGPQLEGHKAVVSGFDMFCFGGHSGPLGMGSGTVEVNRFSLGLDPNATCHTCMSSHSNDGEVMEESESE